MNLLDVEAQGQRNPATVVSHSCSIQPFCNTPSRDSRSEPLEIRVSSSRSATDLEDDDNNFKIFIHIFKCEAYHCSVLIFTCVKFIVNK